MEKGAREAMKWGRFFGAIICIMSVVGVPILIVMALLKYLESEETQKGS